MSSTGRVSASPALIEAAGWGGVARPEGAVADSRVRRAAEDATKIPSSRAGLRKGCCGRAAGVPAY